MKDHRMTSRLLVSVCVTLLIIFFACGCGPAGNKGVSPQDDVLVKNLDTSVSPARDFCSYANGGWVKKNPIPESESRWGIANLVQEETYARLREISEAAGKDSAAASGSLSQKIGDFYFTAMDTAGCEKNGIRPLQPELDRIGAIKDIHGLLNEIAVLQTYQVDALFGIPVFQDEKNSDKMALHIYQGGIGLPNRDYYFNTDDRTANIRKEYVAHVGRIFQLLGADNAAAGRQSAVVMKIETALAAKSRKLADLRDPYKNYNKMSVAEASRLTPRLNWSELLTQVGMKNPDTVIVGQPEFIREADRLLTSFSLDDWKTYLRWQFVHAYSDKLNRAFDLEQFHFYGTVLDGKTAQRERWKRALDAEESAMGELLGQLYVKKYFPVQVKQRYETLVNNIIEAYRERIQKLDWMSPETKTRALEKLSAVMKKVGYPDKWKDYSALSVNRESYVMNAIRANVWAFNYQMGKLGKPVDRTEWDMTPQTYNAYYNPSNNEIVLPAASFIVPGMADSLEDDALVYAYAGGSTIGHELTHGFDDEGRQFDPHGNLRDWWTKDDEVKFNERAKVMEQQFNSYVVLDTMHVNGKACLGENIADLGGILVGYDAFRKTEQAKSGKLINGMTPDQRYFLGYALSWLGHQRDQRLARQIMTDVHAPAFLRVNGPLADVPEFYAAFNVKPGDPMYRPDSLRVKIW
jgi:putative endopeptidase